MKNYSLSKKVTENSGVTIYRLFDDDKEIMKKILPIDIDFVTEDIVLFKEKSYGDSIEKIKTILFDLKEGKILSDEFNEISSFNENRIARANIYFKSGYKFVVVSCYIDMAGNIVSPIVDNFYKVPFAMDNYEIFLDYLNNLEKAISEDDKQFEALVSKSQDKINKLCLKKTI